MKRLVILFALVGLLACEKNDDVIEEPTLKTITVTPVKTDITEVFTDISFGTAKVGYLCGSMGTLMKTTDSGKNWTAIKSDIKPSLNCIVALDDKNVYTARNEIYHTTNGGTSWETAGLENIGSGIFDMHFLNQTTGFILKNGVMKSTDSGRRSYVGTVNTVLIKKLSDSFINTYDSLLNSNRYWELSPETELDKDMSDGAYWVLEVNKNGKYHIVIRNSPGDLLDKRANKEELIRFKQCCKILIDLSDIDSIKTPLY